MPATTNLGEAQHARNNAETGTQIGIIESFKKYAKYDARWAAEINIKLATALIDVMRLRWTKAKAQVEAELKQATSEAKSNYSGRVPARRPVKGKKAETNTQGKASAVRRSSSRVSSRDVEVERDDIQEDEHEGMQGEKRMKYYNWVKKQVDRAKSPSPALHTSPSDAVLSNAKRKLTSAVGPTPKLKRRKAGDPLAGWAIELVPGDMTTAVTPREYAEKEPEEFAAQYPQYVKFL
ncbi:hypothetical protein B0H13DRAFT_1864136 [Mycena leptocephala]|nr:hypothetical protein B0H13DRAFT_1864136 [Mycena leptocephala]